ncbi:hypothetical protein NL676_007056 [Syzygium grande]|nr:hypothetical protein NL676_007056 [Syzygium grande]
MCGTTGSQSSGEQRALKLDALLPVPPFNRRPHMAKKQSQTSSSPSSRRRESLGDDADHISTLPDSVRKFHIDIDFLDYCAPELSPLAMLVNLHLRLFSFPFSRSVGWSNLKPLSICGSEITDKVMHEILKGGPVLECIRLEECCGLKQNVELCSRSLREIVVDRCFWYALDEGFPLKISSPLLLSLHLRGSFGMTRQLAIEATSLIEAELNFFVRREDFGRRTDCSVQNWFVSYRGYCSLVEGH